MVDAATSLLQMSIPCRPTLFILSLLLTTIFGSPLDVQFTAEVTADLGISDSVDVDGGLALKPQTHDVSIGSKDQQIFTPQYVNAALGDVVRFTFMSGNHTLTESTFERPCSPAGAFDTNFFHGGRQHWEDTPSIRVESDVPRWFFCRQNVPTSHCSSGMVFAINPGPYWSDFVAHVPSNISSVRKLPPHESSASAITVGAFTSHKIAAPLASHFNSSLPPSQPSSWSPWSSPPSSILWSSEWPPSSQPSHTPASELPLIITVATVTSTIHRVPSQPANKASIAFHTLISPF